MELLFLHLSSSLLVEIAVDVTSTHGVHLPTVVVAAIGPYEDNHPIHGKMRRRG